MSEPWQALQEREMRNRAIADATGDLAALAGVQDKIRANAERIAAAGGDPSALLRGVAQERDQLREFRGRMRDQERALRIQRKRSRNMGLLAYVKSVPDDQKSE